jgi:hypothetical protein
MPSPRSSLGAHIEDMVRVNDWSDRLVRYYAAFSMRLTSKPSASIRRASRFASTAGS